MFIHRTGLQDRPWWAAGLLALPSEDLGTACRTPAAPLPYLCQQEQLEDMRKKEGHLEREMMEVSAQNKRLTDPLQKARDDVTEMQKKLGNYERDRQTLVVSFGLTVPPSLHVLLG